ncbi:MAG: glycerate kinase [Deltaproteobacteria bacterium]|nr:glycerate kinase [Deltaproteobacteria bacterium]
MRVLVAPCSFKESLTASDAARVLARVARARGHTVDTVAIADGGEGTLDALREPFGLTLRTVQVTGALGAPVRARLGVSRAAVVIEAAEVVGLARTTRARRDPMRATTVGVGQLVRRALELGAPDVMVALGGTATVDGGAGLLHALGVRFLDERGRELAPTPRALTRLAKVDRSGLDPRLATTPLTALTDVRVPLLGPHGARQFMAQKGARQSELATLEGVLRRLYSADLARTPGAGAAGGLGAALVSIGARVVQGIDVVLDAHDVEERAARADVVVTGEGRLDQQTLEGKALAALARLCRKTRTPLVALCGSVELPHKALERAGVIALPIVPGPCPVDDALAAARTNLARAAHAALALLEAGR